MVLNDLSGRIFGRLHVLQRSGKTRPVKWVCKCSCGIERTVRSVHLVTGHTKSCGCLQREISIVVGSASKRHGHSNGGSRTYNVWQAMKARCFTQTHHAYKWYGARGITVCARWMVYENFLDDMGEKPDGLSLDRINNDGNYEPGNCQWATATQQSRNRRAPVRKRSSA